MKDIMYTGYPLPEELILKIWTVYFEEIWNPNDEINIMCKKWKKINNFIHGSRLVCKAFERIINELLLKLIGLWGHPYGYDMYLRLKIQNHFQDHLKKEGDEKSKYDTPSYNCQTCLLHTLIRKMDGQDWVSWNYLKTNKEF